MSQKNELLGITPKGATTEQLFRMRNEEFRFRNAMGGPEFTLRGRRPNLPSNDTEVYRAAPTRLTRIPRGRTETYDKMFGIETELHRKGRPF